MIGAHQLLLRFQLFHFDPYQFDPTRYHYITIGGFIRMHTLAISHGMTLIMQKKNAIIN